MMSLCWDRGRPPRSGFSLLEVILGATIFATIFCGLAATWNFNELSLRKYRNRNAARYLIAQEMERVRAHAYINLEEAVQDREQWLYREIDGVATGQRFEITSRVSENPAHTLKEIAVTLTFEEGSETKSMILRTHIFRAQ